MVLLKGGRIHDGRGHVLEATDILIDAGVIRRIAPGIEAPEAEKVDAAGKDILPGFIETLSTWGGRGPGWGENDLRESSDPVTPELSAIYAFDQDGMTFQEVFRYGVTAAGLAPTPTNVLGGQLAVVKTCGSHPYHMLVKEGAAMMASVTAAVKGPYASRNVCPMTRMGAFSLLTGALHKAAGYGRKKEKDYDAKSEALLPVLAGEMPLLINCNTFSEMDAIDLAMKDFPAVRYAFSGAYALDKGRKSVAQGGHAAVLGDMTQATNFATMEVKFADIAGLVADGAQIVISSGGDSFGAGKESLLWNGLLWHKGGVPAEDVVRMMTYEPARLLGVSDRIGSLEEGKQADLCLWSAHPIKTFAARLEKVYIDGNEILRGERVTSCW